MRPGVLTGTGVLVGTIVGAGFLALPYGASRAGTGAVVLLLALLGAVVTVLHTLFGEIVSVTGTRHRLPGYAELYLGQWGKRVAGLSAFVGYFGGLLVYLLFGGAFLGTILPQAIPAATIIFWLVFTILILIPFRTSSLFDAAASWLLVVMLVVFAAFAARGISVGNFYPLAVPRLAPWIAAYGIVMFSLVGLAAIPEVAMLELLRRRRNLFAVLIAGTAIPAMLYALFTIAVVGARGTAVTANALLDLVPVLPDWTRMLVPVAGVLAIGTSYFTFGTYVKNVLASDFAVPKPLASSVVAAMPIALWLAGFRDIPRIIGFLGGVWISVDVALISLIYERLFPGRKVLAYALISFFVIGTISSIIAMI